MLQEVSELLKKEQTMPVARYFGRYGDLIYIYNQKTKQLHYIALPTFLKEKIDYKEVLKYLEDGSQESYNLLMSNKSSEIRVFKNQYEQERERIFINNLYADVIAIPLEDKIELEEIKERIEKHIHAIRTGS